MSTSIKQSASTDGTRTRAGWAWLSALVAGLLVALVVCLWWAYGRDSRGSTVDGEGTAPRAKAADSPGPILPRPQDDTRTPISQVPLDSTAGSLAQVQEPKIADGALGITARWADDSTAAAGIGISVVGVEGAARSIRRSLETGANGTVSFGQVPTGKYVIASALGGHIEVTIEPRQDALCLIEIPVTRPVEGIVVDHQDTPVAGAHVWLSGGIGGHRPTCGAPTDSYGRFAIRSVGNAGLIGAFADGYSPSLVCDLSTVGEGPHVVKLILTGKGGTVEGVVMSGSNNPIPFSEVTVEVGGPRVGSRVGGETRTSAYPLTVVADAEGRFHVVGVCPGRIAVSARAAGYAPWDGWAEVRPEETASVIATLEEESSLTGVVSVADGGAVANARISVGAPTDPSRRTEFSNAEGIYTIGGLGAGEIELWVEGGQRGSATVRIDLLPHEARELNIVLDPGILLVGQVVTTEGVGLPGWAVYAGSEDGKQYSAVAGAGGEFVIRCDSKAALWLSICDSIENQMPLVILQEIVPGERPVICEVGPEAQRTAHIKGSVLSSGAIPAANCQVRARKLDPPLVGLELSVATNSEGKFTVGPMQPSRYAMSVQPQDGAVYPLGEFALMANAVLDIGSKEIPRAGSFAMSLRYPSGESVGEAEVRVLTADHHELVARQYTAERDGTLLVVENLAPATYAVSIGVAGRPSTIVEVVIRAGERTQEYVVLEGP